MNWLKAFVKKEINLNEGIDLLAANTDNGTVIPTWSSMLQQAAKV